MTRIVAITVAGSTLLACSLGILGQSEACVLPVSDKDAGAKEMQKRINISIQERTAASSDRDKALLRYLRLTPSQRVELWKQGDQKGSPLQRDKDNALIAHGVDAAPYLADIVRKGGRLPSSLRREDSL
jgi:hypothetical protein